MEMILETVQTAMMLSSSYKWHLFKGYFPLMNPHKLYIFSRRTCLYNLNDHFNDDLMTTCAWIKQTT